MRRARYVILITVISLILAAGTVLLIVFDPEYVMQDRAGKVISLLILPLWAFSAVPSYTFAAVWLNEKADFRSGAYLGVCLGILFPLLIAPVLMAFYFVGAVENLIKK